MTIKKRNQTKLLTFVYMFKISCSVECEVINTELFVSSCAKVDE